MERVLCLIEGASSRRRITLQPAAARRSARSCRVPGVFAGAGSGSYRTGNDANVERRLSIISPMIGVGCVVRR